MSKGELSILMANFNHGRFIGESLQAIVDQSYPLKEMIIIDDASTDDSMEVIRAFHDKLHNLRVIKNERNMGVVHNANTLLSLSSGEYVYFAAADDRVLTGCFGKAMSLLSKHPEAGLCSGLSTVIDKNGDEIGLHQSGKVSDIECYLAPEDVAAILSKRPPWFMGNTTIYRRQCLIDVGGFRPDLEAFCDGFASLLIALRHGCCFVPGPLAAWRHMEGGYAWRCSNDPRNWEPILRKAAQIMRTVYRDLVPPYYADLWERKQLHDMRLTNTIRRHNARLERLRERWVHKSRFGRSAYQLMKPALGKWLLVRRFYLFAKYRQPLQIALRSKYEQVSRRWPARTISLRKALARVLAKSR